MQLRRLGSWAWQRISYLLAVVLIVHGALFLYWLHRPGTVDILEVVNAQPLSHEPPPYQDEHSSPMTSDECLSIFPDLYHEIDRAVALWNAKEHRITQEDVDISWQATGPLDGGALRIMIHKNELRVLESINAMADPAYQERGLGILRLLQVALESATAGDELLPTIEAAIVLQDVSYPPTENGTHSFWTWTQPVHDIHFNRTNVWEGKELHYERYWYDTTFQRVWLVPNFDFWYTKSIGFYQNARERATQHDTDAKIPQIVWRGTEWVNPSIRDVLVNTTKGKPWANVSYSDTSTRDHHLAPDDLCQYAMTVHTEGFSYSGRLTHLLNCNSLPFIHHLDYTTHYYHLLQSAGPHQNYVAVRNDFSDLEARVLYYLAHPHEAHAIIANHVATFRERYLAPAATSCHLRRLIQQYATVAYTPAVSVPGTEGSTAGMRGRDLQMFLDDPEDLGENL